MLIPTSLVGSYPQPDWLIDRERLSKDVPRIRAENLWRVAPDKLEAAQDDATILAIREQERAGLTIITDGEQRRESYSNRFATALDGIDAENPGTTLSRIGKPIPVPRVVGPIRRKHPVLLRDLESAARQHRSPGQDDHPRPVHHEQTGAGRLLSRRRSGGARITPPRSTPKSSISSPPAPISCSSTSRGCSSIRTMRGAMGSRRSTARSTASPARSRCICVSAMPRWSTASLRATRSCRSWKTPRRRRSPSKRRSRASI